MFINRMKLEDGSLQFAVNHESVLNVKYDAELSANDFSNWYLFTVDGYSQHIGIKGNYLNGIYTFLLESKSYLPQEIAAKHDGNFKLILSHYFVN